MCVEFGQGIVVQDDVAHFLDFLGVLDPPFFLGVLKSLSHNSHTHSPEETERDVINNNA